MKIGLLCIATKKYINYTFPLWESVQKYFMSGTGYEINMFVFTDMREVPSGVTRIEQPHAPWPAMTLMRYHIFSNHEDQLSKNDYLFYSDADMLFVDKVGDEILGDLVGTIHPGFWNKSRDQFAYEKRPQSTAYIPPHMGKKYYCGGFNGGRADRYLAMARTIRTQIDIDLEKNIVAEWHDESHLNKFFSFSPPTVELTPSYCYPEGKTPESAWARGLPFHPRLIALDKNHNEARS